MDYRLWLALIGIASTLVIFGFQRAGRKNANAHILARGALAEGEIVESKVEGSRFQWTTVTYSFIPGGSVTPLLATRKLDGGISLERGQRVAVAYLPSHPYVSILVDHKTRHDAS
jgi:hypothetical protein